MLIVEIRNRRADFVLRGIGGEGSLLQHMYLWTIKVELFNRLLEIGCKFHARYKLELQM